MTLKSYDQVLSYVFGGMRLVKVVEELFFSCLHNIAVASEALLFFLRIFAYCIIKTDCDDPYIYSRSVCD